MQSLKTWSVPAGHLVEDKYSKYKVWNIVCKNYLETKYLKDEINSSLEDIIY